MATLPCNAQLFKDYFYKDKWTWDPSNRSEDVVLSTDNTEAYFFIDAIKGSTGTAGVRGTQGFSEGEYYWEVKFLEAACGNSIMIGVGTASATLHMGNGKYVDLLGQDVNSWGLSFRGTVHHNGQSRKYCDPFFSSGTVIGVYLNLYTGILSFYKNSEHLGMAFTNLNNVKKPLYPMISANTPESELGLVASYHHYLSLEQKCFWTVHDCLSNAKDVDSLMLPNVMKNNLREMWQYCPNL
ncbi:SPRY domain-containing SOCS box protein 3 [Lingula anatina]|uniref:SPRY domain-containing SOCS box protein 3 n=1 Tax=Lingula anatina TaxID=7574 RepID=A0A1S3HHW0_LINAN|nr:SPRY domain-containing SOCS box protein 3 [Lingula anatina]|eukprot:XP_013385695.1 SPRY domain-containing SOCS box protein 3 [Lingula anatina]